MKSLDKAIKHAINLSKSHATDYFVVYSPNEYDEPENDYHVSNDFNLDTFYMGCEILFATEDYYAHI